MARHASLAVSVVVTATSLVGFAAEASGPTGTERVQAAAQEDIRPAVASPSYAAEDLVPEHLRAPLPGIEAELPTRQEIRAELSTLAEAQAAQERLERERAERIAARAAMWDRLADCESGDWRSGTPMPDTRRWDYGLTFSHGDIFEGGLNFHPQTWDAYRDPGMPSHAGRATRAQQIAVAEQVLADQGWGAWPVCSRKLGYR